MDNDRVARRTALGFVNPADRLGSESVCAQAINSFGRKGDQTACAQDRGGFFDDFRIRMLWIDRPKLGNAFKHGNMASSKYCSVIVREPAPLGPAWNNSRI